MLRIGPQPLSLLQMRLGTCLKQFPAECRDQLTEFYASFDEREEVPTVQLSYDEIPATEIDRLLGYAGIASNNAPIGVEGNFSPRTIGHEQGFQFLLFPLSGLERHLVSEEPTIAESLQNLFSMNAFVEDRGDAMTASEYLTAGVLTCIRFCRTRKQAFVITW